MVEGASTHDRNPGEDHTMIHGAGRADEVARPGADQDMTTLLESIQHISRKLSSKPTTQPGVEPLTPLEQLVLQTVQRSPGTTATQVSATLNILPSNTSTALGRLQELGLVQRARDPHDGRRMTLRLTDTALRNIDVVHQGWIDQLAGVQVSKAQLAGAARVLSVIDAALTE